MTLDSTDSHAVDAAGRATVDVVVAGHICLDIIPALNHSQQHAEDIFIPGRLINIGPATVSLGGAVSNAGQALHRLGFGTRLIGKVGDDALGQMIAGFLDRMDPDLATHLVVSPGEASSYSLILNPPGIDRCFLHCTGANDTFKAMECPVDVATTGQIFHFGYPPLMREIYSDAGVGLAKLLSEVQDAGVVTSLDLAFPDPESSAGKVDWSNWLRCVLPNVNVFLPSFDEVLLMLTPQRYWELTQKASGGNLASFADIKLISEVADRLNALGPAIVGLKLGDEGLFLKTVDASRCFLNKIKMERHAHRGLGGSRTACSLFSS